MARKTRDDFDDDEDDRPRPPRRRRPRDDDEDEDDDRSPKKAGGPNKLVIMVVGLTVVTVLGLLCAGILAVRYFSTPAKVPVPGPGQGQGQVGGQGAGPGAGTGLTPEQEAANRATARANMQQIAIAMHNQCDGLGALQGPFTPATNGGHSFRVGLLPYVEQTTLFNRIDLKQPWDSERNVLITNTVVSAYLDPSNPAPLGTATPYRMFVGPGAVFDGKGRTPLLSISDGTSNTLMFVQAAETVPWAKPQELPYGPGVPLPPLGSPQADTFSAAMADGSVRSFRKKISEANLRSLIEKSDGRGQGLE